MFTKTISFRYGDCNSLIAIAVYRLFGVRVMTTEKTYRA